MHVRLLLRDRLDGRIRLRKLDAPQAVQDAHHLFLIDHHPVRFLENLLEHGVKVRRLLSAVLDVDVIVDHAAVQRPRAIKRIGRNDVGKPVGLHLDQAGRGCRTTRAGTRPSIRRAAAARTSWRRPAEGCRCRSARSGCRSLMRLTAASSVVKFRSPRKSIFSRPAFSMSPISHWVVTTSLALSLFGSF